MMMIFQHVLVVTLEKFCKTIQDASCMDHHLLPCKGGRAHILHAAVRSDIFFELVWIICLTFYEIDYLHVRTTAGLDRATN